MFEYVILGYLAFGLWVFSSLIMFKPGRDDWAVQFKGKPFILGLGYTLMFIWAVFFWPSIYYLSYKGYLKREEEK